MSDQSEILIEVTNGVARVTLNRPEVLNALTRKMCVALRENLSAWAQDPEIHMVLLKGAGRAFCAGADIRRMHEIGHDDPAQAIEYYREEYSLDVAVSRFPKPYVVLMDGIVMGGGLAVSEYGTARVITENVQVAMPETGIGLFPDVGAIHLLSRCPGEIGMFLGLTGTRVSATDTIYGGLADYFVPSDRLAGLEEDLMSADLSSNPAAEIRRLIELRAEEPSGGELIRHQRRIDFFFSFDSVEEILAELNQDGGAWESGVAETLRRKSPTSLKLAHRLIREHSSHDLAYCLRAGWRVVNRTLAGHDFYEGVRAVIIDKDKAPNWQPSTLSAISDADVDSYFEPLAEGDLDI